MRRSKLEICVDVLEILALNGPLKITHIMYKTNLNCNALRGLLNFLVAGNLVEERTIQKRRSLKKGVAVYAITQHGHIILKSFIELNKLLPVEEALCCYG